MCIWNSLYKIWPRDHYIWKVLSGMFLGSLIYWLISLIVPIPCGSRFIVYRVFVLSGGVIGFFWEDVYHRIRNL